MRTDEKRQLLVGIDIGSTTVKAAAVDACSHNMVFSTYRRHHAHQAETAILVLDEVDQALAQQFGSESSTIFLAVTGSGGKDLASALGVPYVQEVVANSIAVATHYPKARVAIELGGQDAKMVFFEPGQEEGTLKVTDMRMNGSCAGGTGAFLDEIASLLKTPVEELDGLAARGTTLYSISGRCGVFAKTDIQPLINQGVAKEDIALSTFHAVAKQTLGGLAQGLDIIPPVIFEGGPLTFNPTLIKVFEQRLGIGGEDAIVPESPQTIVARGAALSLKKLFDRDDDVSGQQVAPLALDEAKRRLQDALASLQQRASSSAPFFASDEELAAFRERHELAPAPPGPAAYQAGESVPVYLGIDSGSTTTKFALIDEDDELVDSFYASNEGEPLDVAREALIALGERWQAAGVSLDIQGMATTGYGEMLFAKAFHADCHVVETVAHALAAACYVDDATFILDIGGQDMKAIWIDRGIVTDILVNEACSSGCGSFLENFAKTLGFATSEIANAAFRSKSPAELGSRCTVFMTSSVVTEQKNGKSPEDIMAGLCRSIIENVFTKVIRVPNLDSLGQRIVVQGGTFANDAVLAAFEAYVGRDVTRAPYPGLMGAIGAALFAKRNALRERRATNLPDGARLYSQFIGLEGVRNLTYTTESNVTCPFCTNNCARSVVTFSDGSHWVTGNRCERGEIVGDPRDLEVRERLGAVRKKRSSVPNLFETREKLLFATYDAPSLAEPRGITIGLPRVLAFWDTMPFWTTFWRSLGFAVKISPPSTRDLFERSLPAVASDTVCFPAKLVHGHIRALEDARVDRIFMPSITTVPTENTEKTSESMCAVVKGYPIVMRNSDNPEQRSNAVFDAPLFHWYSEADSERQLCAWMGETFGIDSKLTAQAIKAANAAQSKSKADLLEAGARVIEEARRNDSYAVVLASRPYHNDALVNHSLPDMFVEQGIPVLPPDAVPDIKDIDLSKSRLDIVNNYHARMIGCAIRAACDPSLEYAQVVSFGCGHDAYLSDEIVRVMHQIGEKSPLVLKVDEGDVAGPLRIRIRSFVETINIKRAEHVALPTRPLEDPYAVKFRKSDRRRKVALVPNTSKAFSRLMAVVLSKQGIRAVSIAMGREEAIRLGKQYVHNDICFPAQIVIGETLAALRSGKYDDADVAVFTAKYIGDCRLTHYGALLRKALDDAGYAHVPIITNDDVDYHDLHPGFKLNTLSSARIAFGLPMIDALEELLRKMRPYELVPGSANAAFEQAIDTVMDGMAAHGIRGAQTGFKRAIKIMRGVEYDRSNLRPRVLIVGEYLLNFHPGANHDVELYLEDNGFEIIEAKMTDVIRKTYFYKKAQIAEYGVDKPSTEAAWYSIANRLFDHAHNMCDRIASAHPLYEPSTRMPELVEGSDPIIHHTFDAGEGVLIPGEIIHHANQGCEAFLILQPFGCLPNHIVGRGIVKRLKELYPSVQILSLDYDPDVSFANIENRLQMLVMNVRESHNEDAPQIDLGALEQSIADIVSQETMLAEEVLRNTEVYGNIQSDEVPDAMSALTERMREILEMEDRLAASARDALASARRAAQQAQKDAADASENLVAAALHAYEIARDMRTRTRQSMAATQSALASMSSGASETLSRVAEEVQVRAEDARTFANRVIGEAKKISGRP
ncbi:MAG: acyl-CoA dehydratase activase [Coriobacteriales bacterium]|nr:acyl-CoA dehydratase activase [Coriobacteriales bacterium]